jgi:hypothetical protein
MAAGSDVVARKVAALGMAMLQPAQGLAALERLLCSPALPCAGAGPAGLPAVAPVVPFRWGAFFRAGSDRAASEMFDRALATGDARRVARHGPAARRVAAPRAAPRDALPEVQEAIAGVLGRQVRGRRRGALRAGEESAGSADMPTACACHLPC